MENKAVKKKDNSPRTYEDICADISAKKGKGTENTDRYVSLLKELSALKDLTQERIQLFFASVNEVIEDAWSPFLVKASMCINPSKKGTDGLIATEIMRCCYDVLNSCGLAESDLKQACRSFCESKDAAYITGYLKLADTVSSMYTADNTEPMIHKITPQELACITFICFNLTYRGYSSYSNEPLVKIDRAIAEYFSKAAIKEHAGKTLGGILASKVFSAKKITELVYLYSDTTESINQQAECINDLTNANSTLRARNASLEDEISSWKVDHENLVTRIEFLEAEKEQFHKERVAAENMLEYERNKFKRLMESREAGIAEQLASMLKLELNAIQETIEYIDEKNQRRISRRLQRIDEILHDFGGEEDA